MEKNRNITISHSNFHQEIINKYQNGKRNPFRFPVMLFYKHTGDSVSRKIMRNILLQLHFYNRNIVSSFIVKGVQSMERLFSWFRTENLKSVHNITKMLPLIQDKTALGILPVVHELVNSVSLVLTRPPVSSWFENTSLTLKKVIQQFFPIADAVFYPRAFWNVSALGFTVNRQLFNYRNNVWKYHFIRKHKSPTILPQVTLFLNKSSNETFQNWTIVHKPLIQHYHDQPGFDVTNFGAIQRRTTFTTDSEHFYFHKQRKIDQEIEEIRKIMVETKEAVTDNSQTLYPPIDVEIKKHLDINRLSEQVYQNIERRIRIERERRGL